MLQRAITGWRRSEAEWLKFPVPCRIIGLQRQCPSFDSAIAGFSRRHSRVTHVEHTDPQMNTARCRTAADSSFQLRHHFRSVHLRLQTAEILILTRFRWTVARLLRCRFSTAVHLCSSIARIRHEMLSSHLRPITRWCHSTLRSWRVHLNEYHEVNDYVPRPWTHHFPTFHKCRWKFVERILPKSTMVTSPRRLVTEFVWCPRHIRCHMTARLFLDYQSTCDTVCAETEWIRHMVINELR